MMLPSSKIIDISKCLLKAINAICFCSEELWKFVAKALSNEQFEILKDFLVQTYVLLSSLGSSFTSNINPHQKDSEWPKMDFKPNFERSVTSYHCYDVLQ